MTVSAPNISSPATLAQRLRRATRAHPHFVLIALVFLIFRLLMPLGFVSLGPDVVHYMRWGALADSRLYPYIHYWSEYPPLFGWSAIGLYRLSTLVPAWPEDPSFWFGLVLKTTMAGFDMGSLTLVYAIARQLGRKAEAVRTAALFAGGFITAYAAWGWYDEMPLFFLLLALYWTLRDRPIRSAVAAVVGLMIKIVPIVIAPVALRRMLSFRQRAAYLIALGATTVLILLPFLTANASYLAAFVSGTFSRPAWGSIWAVFEGHYEFGSVVPVVERFSLESAGASLDSPLPWPLIHLAFAGLFLLLYTRRIDWRNAAHTVAFAGMTVNLFLLWSRGFSGQFTVYAFPFILLLMPNRRGVGYAGLLAVLWIAEWPGALFVTPEGPQEPNYFLMWLIIARTAILIALCLEYAALLFPRTAAHLPRAAAVILAAGWISVVPMSALLIDTYMRSQLAADPSAPAVDLIRDSGGGPNKTIVFAASRIFRRLYPLARSAGDTLLLPLAKHVPEDVRLAWLDELAARGPFWFIADESDPGSLDENREAEAWVSRYACKVDTQIAGSARVSRFIGPGEMSIDARAVFGDEIALAGARLSAQALQAGDGLCVELDWQALTQPSGDYTVFVHLIDSGGRLMTQNDMPPRGGFAPTGSWPTGSILTDGHGLILPGNLSPGAYTLRVGLYRSDNQAPVPVTQGSQILQDAIGIVLAGVSVIP